MNRSSSTVMGDRTSVSRILCYLLFVLLGYAAWIRGGVYPPLQWPMVTLSALLLGGLLLFGPERRILIRNALLRDPVFYLGLAFLLILAVQWGNSGYFVVWDRVETVVMSRMPSRWLPWSVEPNTASQMINWFLPAWAAVLTVRHALDRTDIMLLLYCMVWNAAVLAVVALIQYLVGATRMLGLWEIPQNNFFGTFGYINHAGAWFYLHAALAAGLAQQVVRRNQPFVQILVWCICFLLCLAAAFLTLSRAAALASVILVFGVFVLLVAWGWKRSRGNQVVNGIGLACIAALFGAVLYLGAGGGSLAREIDKTFLGEGLQQSVEARTLQLPSAWEIVGDYPLFGCGGWGYRWMALMHIPVEEWPHWQGAGKANVHCDPLQFLVEFGAVGWLLMAAVIAVLLYCAVRNRNSRALRNWMALGLLLIFLHGFVDLPFRAPAILIAWCTLFAVLGRLPARRSGGANLETLDEW